MPTESAQNAALADAEQLLRELLNERRLLTEAQASANIGSWQYDVVGQRRGAGIWTPQMWQILGRREQRTAPPMSYIFDQTLLEDRPRVTAEVQGTISRGEPCREEFRVTRPDGSTIYVDLRCEVELDDAGEVTLVRGTMQDVTERKRAETALRLESEITAHMAEGALLISEANRVIVHVNPAAERIFGYEPGEIVGAHISILNAETELTARETAETIIDKIDEHDGLWSGEILSRRRDGSQFWRQSTVSRFNHPEFGSVLVSVIIDVTERHEREAEERAIAAITQLVAHGASPSEVFDVVAMEVQGLFDAHVGSVVRFDAGVGLGVVAGGWAVDGQQLTGAAIALDEDNAFAGVYASQAPARVETPEASEESAKNGEGGIAAPIRVNGELWGAVGAGFRGVAVPPRAEARLARFCGVVGLAIANAAAWEKLSTEATTDALTGIANRRAFTERLHAELERSRRYGRSLSIAVLDVDHFKRVNDVHGHQVGDVVLTEIANRLVAEVREGELVARIGGEEFAWVMPETSAKGALGAAERLRLAIAAQAFPVVGSVTISAGVCASEPGIDMDELIRCADDALYQAKESGRNTVCVFEEFCDGLSDAA